MKILFIGDYSNLHTTLAHELRKMGHQADILSDKCGYMNLDTDFFLKREPGIKGGLKYLYDIFNLLPKLEGYDAVQLINTNFLKLKPAKIKYFFDRLKEQNGSMYLTLAGNDYYYVKACYEGKMFRFSEFKMGDEFTPGAKRDPEHMYGWMSNANKKLGEYIYDEIKGAMSVLPEYDMYSKPLLGERVAFTNLPIELRQLAEPSNFVNDKVRIFVAMRSGVEHWKGTKLLLELAQEIEKEMSEKVEVEVARDLPFQEFISRMSKADIVFDQLYAYSPAMTALYAMGMGKAVATGAQPEYYEYIGNPEIHPIISISPFDRELKSKIISLVKDRDQLLAMGDEAKKIVLNNNRSDIVAEKFLRHWEN